MDTPRHILVVVERNEAALQALGKACAIARQTGARLELFLCDAECGYSLRHAYDQRGVERAMSALVEDARRYLDALRRSVAAADLDIAIDASCDTPLYECIVRKVLQARPDLVVKQIGAATGTSAEAPGPNDWHLVRTCPAPLLLSRRKAWQPQPRVLACVDVGEPAAIEHATLIGDAAARFASDFHGELHLIHGSDGSVREPLATLAGRWRLGSERLHVLGGEPTVALPEAVRANRYDLVVLGALGHPRGAARLVGSLTDAMLNRVDSDFLLLKPAAFVCPVEPRAARPAEPMETPATEIARARAATAAPQAADVLASAGSPGAARMFDWQLGA